MKDVVEFVIIVNRKGLGMRNVKNKIAVLLATTSLLSFGTSASFAEDKPSCASLGYTTDSRSCVDRGGSPLMCPYSILNDTDATNTDCICLSKSCRGYPLFKVDDKYYYLPPTGGNPVEAIPSVGTIEGNIDGEMESCTVGLGNDAHTYYRVPKCKEGFLYQNNICDEGCDTINTYPFETHPGNLAGEVQICKDEKGEHYGYIECNDGWKLSNGRCNLNSCDIKEYPYMSNPNDEEHRGEVESCKIGGNAYYKYSSCIDGFEPKGSVCVSTCEITNCSYTTATEGHREWTCKLNNPKCRIGDTAVYDGINIGTIFHLPDAEDNRVHVMGIAKNIRWGIGEASTTFIDNLLETYIYEGKKNTKIIDNFRIAQNWNKGGVNSFPAVEYCLDYNVNCVEDTMCAVGEWYLPAYNELYAMYNSRFFLHNIHIGSDVEFFSNNKGVYLWSSTGGKATTVYIVGMHNGILSYNLKQSSGWMFPILSFTAK